MGCDIHLVLEKKHGKKWVGIDTFAGHQQPKWMVAKGMSGYSSPIARERNYERFAALANVRGPGPKPRGLPKDASDTTKLMVERWGGDGHSHSWLPLAEAANIFDKTNGPQDSDDDFVSKYPTSHFFGVDVSEGSNEKISDYRVVFWFDN